MTKTQKSLSQLRTLHPRFIYENYDWKIEKSKNGDSHLKLVFEFTLENSLENQPSIQFHPTIIVRNISSKQISAIPSQIFENFIFHLGLMEIPSYWKATCSPQIIIRAHNSNTNYHLPFTNHQTTWWNDLLIKGLGEFFYTNNIDFTKKDFVTWEVENKEKIISKPKSLPQPPTTDHQPPTTNYLVPIGGGKDSALTIGILDKHHLSYSCLVLEPHSPASLTIIEKSHPTQIITAKRTIDPKLLKLNSLGYMNGHTPFSAYLAFLSSLTALLFGIEHILLSNERSANEGNIEFHGQTINHQYSKTFEFEEKFRDYTKKWIYNKKNKGKNSNYQLLITNYHSFLRPLYEIQIARLFAQYPQYHLAFRSCNVGQKENKWCHSCPKCLFVFTMLFPFIETKILTTQIFDHNLYEDKSLLPLMLELLGETKHKPLECVGTYEEVLAAVFLSVEKYKEITQNSTISTKLPLILQKISDEILKNPQHSLVKGKDLNKMSLNLLNSWNNEHNLPENLEKILKDELQSQK